MGTVRTTTNKTDEQKRTDGTERHDRRRAKQTHTVTNTDKSEDTCGRTETRRQRVDTHVQKHRRTVDTHTHTQRDCSETLPVAQMVYC